MSPSQDPYAMESAEAAKMAASITTNDASDDDNDDEQLLLQGWQTMKSGFQGDLEAQRRDPFVSTCYAMIRDGGRLICGTCAYVITHPTTTMRKMQQFFGQSEEDRYHDLTIDSSLWDHLQGLGNLSRAQCLILIPASLVAMLLLRSVTIVLASLLQPLLILYIVYWRRHRLHLSLNLVVQYFMAGCIYCFLIAVLKTVALILCAVLVLTDTIQDSSVFNIFGTPLFLAVHAFILAGAVEECLKYQAFSLSRTQQRDTSASSGEQQESLILSNDDVKSSLVTMGAAITCAMVAVATGFGWIETLIYLFEYDSSATVPYLDVNPWSVVIGRTILAVHPLLAGIQAISVCRRDLEGRSGGIVMMLLPAILFHGLYYFLLLPIRSDYQEHKLVSVYEARHRTGAALLTLVFAIAYYIVCARKQRGRLQILDQQPQVRQEAAESSNSEDDGKGDSERGEG